MGLELEDYETERDTGLGAILGLVIFIFKAIGRKSLIFWRAFVAQNILSVCGRWSRAQAFLSATQQSSGVVDSFSTTGGCSLRSGITVESICQAVCEIIRKDLETQSDNNKKTIDNPWHWANKESYTVCICREWHE